MSGAPLRAPRGPGATVAALLLLLAACVPAGPGGTGAAALLYVANGLDGTVVRLDARAGRRLGPPRPVGQGAVELAVGRDGAVLVRSIAVGRGSTLTYAGPPDGGAAPAARPLPLGAALVATHLAGDGARTAGVAYVVAGLGAGAAASPCGLAVVDLDRGAVVHRLPVCAPREQIGGLAVGDAGAGPVAYVGLWQEGAPLGRPGAGRVVALDAARGVVLAAAPLDGAAGGLGLAPARDRPGARLYAAVAALDADPTASLEEATRFAQARRWRLQGLDAETLALERDFALAAPALGLTVAPDGRDAYAFATDYRPAGRLLQRIDLLTGAVSPGGSAPGFGVGGLAVTADRLYVADPFNDRLWTADRAGRPRGTIPVGRRPTGIATGRAGAP